MRGSNPILQWLDTICADTVPQKIQFSHSKLAFGGVDDEAVVAEALQYQLQVVFVLVGRCTGDQQVVNVRIAKCEAT